MGIDELFGKKRNPKQTKIHDLEIAKGTIIDASLGTDESIEDYLSRHKNGELTEMVQNSIFYLVHPFVEAVYKEVFPNLRRKNNDPDVVKRRKKLHETYLNNLMRLIDNPSRSYELILVEDEVVYERKTKGLLQRCDFDGVILSKKGQGVPLGKEIIRCSQNHNYCGGNYRDQCVLHFAKFFANFTSNRIKIMEDFSLELI